MSIPDTPTTQPTYTYQQGQYLAFIHYYTKVNGRPPAHTDLQRYFRVTPPSVHRMLTHLQEKGLIHKQPGAARSLALAIPVEQLPGLD